MGINHGTESDFGRLVRMADKARSNYIDIGHAEWATSPLNWIRQLPSSHKKGKVGEEIVRAWAASEGVLVDGRGTRGHDCVVAGLRIEVKTSLRWNSNRFVFLGLRDFDYDAVAFLGLEPNGFRLWIVPKRLVWERAKYQLRGVSGRGSKWVSFLAGRPPRWLAGWGGSFAEAKSALEQARRYGQRKADESSTDHSPEIDWSWLDKALQVGQP